MPVFYPGLILLIGFFVLAWFRRLPSIQQVHEALDLINTKGGNIALLLFGTLIGGAASLRLFYYIIQLSVDGKIQQDNVFSIMSLSFITGTITGNFMGALLKTMTGDTVVHPKDKEPPSGG
jgi:hypothetical protein